MLYPLWDVELDNHYELCNDLFIMWFMGSQVMANLRRFEKRDALKRLLIAHFIIIVCTLEGIVLVSNLYKEILLSDREGTWCNGTIQLHEQGSSKSLHLDLAFYTSSYKCKTHQNEWVVSSLACFWNFRSSPNTCLSPDTNPNLSKYSYNAA